jgi:hypothetical protein
MNKKMFRLMAGLCMIFVAVALAEHCEAQEDGKRVEGYVFYRTNLISPDRNKNFWSHDLNAYSLVDGKYGLGLDNTYCPDKDYFRTKPFATVNVAGGLNLLGGLSLDNTGGDYAQLGFWYFGKLGEKVNIFLDPRFYTGTSEGARDFFEGYAEISYPLNDKFTLAINVLYDHWWENNTNWMLVGPVVYWKINSSITVFARIARETNFEGGDATDIRTAIKLSF